VVFIYFYNQRTKVRCTTYRRNASLEVPSAGWCL